MMFDVLSFCNVVFWFVELLCCSGVFVLFRCAVVLVCCCCGVLLLVLLCCIGVLMRFLL